MTPTPDAPKDDIPNTLAQDVASKNSYLPYSLINCNQYWKNVPNTKKNMTTNIDAPDAYAPNDAKYDATDAPDAVDYDSDYPKLIHLSLRNINWNRKIAPNTKKNKNNMTPNNDSLHAANDGVQLQKQEKQWIPKIMPPVLLIMTLPPSNILS